MTELLYQLELLEAEYESIQEVRKFIRDEDEREELGLNTRPIQIRAQQEQIISKPQRQW